MDVMRKIKNKFFQINRNTRQKFVVFMKNLKINFLQSILLQVVMRKLF